MVRMADAKPSKDNKVSRQDRLDAQREAFLRWAATATTDDVPGDFDAATPPAE